MEGTLEQEFKDFIRVIKRARAGLPELNHHDLVAYCNTLLNGATILQAMNSMACSDRLDLVDGSEDGSNPTCDEFGRKLCTFCFEYLGLRAELNGDPRGAPIKIVVPEGMGNSWGSRSLYCVPCSDSYQAFF